MEVIRCFETLSILSGSGFIHGDLGVKVRQHAGGEGTPTTALPLVLATEMIELH